MDDVPLCPPYWPELVWSLIHPHWPDPEPPRRINRELVAELDAHFASIAVAALVSRFSDEKVGQQIGNLANKATSNPMPGLAELGGLAMAGR
jgi:hypothetical protein